MEKFTRYQATHHPVGETEEFRSPELYALFKMQEFDYKDVAPTMAGKRVLDWGCNSGHGAALISQYADVTGIDVSDASIVAARSRHPGLKFSKFDGIHTDFPAGSFDMILLFQVLEHIVDPAPAFREIARLLHPAGRVIVTTPNATLRLQGRKPWNRFHVREYTPEMLRECLGSAFRIVSLEGLNMSTPLRNAELHRIAKRRFGADATTRLVGAAERTIREELAGDFAVTFSIQVKIESSRDRDFTFEQVDTALAGERPFFYQKDRLEDCFSLRCIMEASSGRPVRETPSSAPGAP